MLRAFRLLVSVWFLLVLVDPEAVHSCPLHSSSSAAATDHSAHDVNAHHDAQQSLPDNAKCSCPDDCATASTAVQPAVAERHVAVSIVEYDVVQPIPGIATLALPPPFLLPFANGPPSIPA